MIYLKDELYYLENLEITTAFDIELYEEIKKFVYKILEMNNFEEIYLEYKKFNESTNLTFPRIEDTIVNKDNLDIENIKTKIVVCCIDRILGSRK
jgi:Iap family predicted aminopeptidase